MRKVIAESPTTNRLIDLILDNSAAEAYFAATFTRLRGADHY